MCFVLRDSWSTSRASRITQHEARIVPWKDFLAIKRNVANGAVDLRFRRIMIHYGKVAAQQLSDQKSKAVQ